MPSAKLEVHRAPRPPVLLLVMLFIGVYMIFIQFDDSSNSTEEVSGSMTGLPTGEVPRPLLSTTVVGPRLTFGLNAPPRETLSSVERSPRTAGEEHHVDVARDISSTGVPNSSTDAFLSAWLDCAINGYSFKDGTNSIFDAKAGRCVPLPRTGLRVNINGGSDDEKRAKWEWGGPYQRGDYGGTVIPTAEAARREEENGADDSSVDVGSSGNRIALRTTPSVHSRWLFDEWRMWEGELGCTKEGAPAPPAPAAAEGGAAPPSFVTTGHHNHSTPNSLYQLDYFCVDAVEGTLVEFVDEATALNAVPSTSPTSPPSYPSPPSRDAYYSSGIKESRGVMENFMNVPFASTVKLLNEHNRRPVVMAKGGLDWHGTVKGSLLREYQQHGGGGRMATAKRLRPLDGPTVSGFGVVNWTANGPQEDSGPAPPTAYRYPLPPRIQFIDDVALVVPLAGDNFKNPYHQYGRLASASTQQRLVEATNTLFLADTSAVDPTRRSPHRQNRWNSLPLSREGYSALGPYWSTHYLLRQQQGAAAGGHHSKERYMTRSADNEGGHPLTLIPHYLLTAEEQREWSDRRGASPPTVANRNDAVAGIQFNVSRAVPHTYAQIMHDNMYPLGPQGIYDSIVSDPPTTAAAAVLGVLQTQYMTYTAFYKPLMHSGEEGCDCAPAGEDGDEQCTAAGLTSYRRCARPWAMLPLVFNGLFPMRVRNSRVASSAKETDDYFNTTFSYETFNYSRLVWNSASTATMREAQRMRREVWEIVVTGSTNDATLSFEGRARDPLLQGHSYLAEWRHRLVSRLAALGRSAAGLPRNESTASAPFDKASAVAAYFNEYFALHLEEGSAEEGGGGSAHQSDSHGHVGSATPAPLLPQRQELMCYRRAYIYHVHYERRPLNYNTRGNIALALPANCHTREAVMMSYQSAWAAYGQCAVGGSTNQSSSSPLRNPNHDAHPLFALPSAERAGLQEAFGRSRTLIDAALADGLRTLQQQQPPASVGSGGGGTTTTADPSLALLDDPNFLGPLLGRIDEAMMGYDELLMAYFREGGRGRRIRLYTPYRSRQRPMPLLRPQLSKLMLEGLGDYVSLTVDEGTPEGVHSVGREALRQYRRNGTVPLASAPSPLTTPLSVQMRAVMGTDLFVGLHGADMYSIAYAKPSAYVTELCPHQTDWYTHSFEGGFFAALAYSRSVGYMKVMVHTFNSIPMMEAPSLVDPIRRREPITEMQAYLTMPELRNMYSATVCGWLSVNALRLANEAAAAGAAPPFDNSYLLPWWCRGGPAAIVEDFVHAARIAHSLSEKSDPQPAAAPPPVGHANTRPGNASTRRPLHADGRLGLLLEAVSAVRQFTGGSPTPVGDYYRSRGIPSGFGPFVAMGTCWSLRAGLEWGLNATSPPAPQPPAMGGPPPPSPSSASGVVVMRTRDALGTSKIVAQHRTGHINAAADGGGGVGWASRLIAYVRLEAQQQVSRVAVGVFQNRCAVRLTLGAFANSFDMDLVNAADLYVAGMRRRAEGLQTLLETAVLMPSGLASHLGRVMTQGHGVVADYEGRRLEREVYPYPAALPAPSSSSTSSSTRGSGGSFICGVHPLFDESLYDKSGWELISGLNPRLAPRWECLRAMLRVVLADTHSPNASVAHSRVDAAAAAAMRSAMSSHQMPALISASSINNATWTSLVVEYIAFHYFQTYARPTVRKRVSIQVRETLVEGTAASFGHGCLKWESPEDRALRLAAQRKV